MSKGQDISTSVEQELSSVVAHRGLRRLEALASLEHPQEVAQALSKAEVFVTYGELEEAPRRALISVLSREQIDHLLDLDLWCADGIDPERAAEWMDRLVGAGDEAALTWLRDTSSELAVAILQRLIVVHEGPPQSLTSQTESQDALPPFTSEGVFYVEFLRPELSKPLKRMLVLLAGEDLEYYLSLLQEVLALTPAEAEEEALDQRWNRLRDEGFLPPDEAYEIYRWPDGADLEEPEEAPPRPPATTALALAEAPSVLATALSEVEDQQLLDEWSGGLAYVAALILSADHLPMSDLDAHKGALKKSLGYVSIGVELLSEGDVARARELLASRAPAILFRTGYREVAALGRRALVLKRLGWLSHAGFGLEILGSPLTEVIQTLAQPRPAYPAVLCGGGQSREFQTLAEVVQCSELLARAEALGTLFVDALGMPHAPPELFDLTGCTPPEEELSLGLIICTALAQLVLDQSLRFEAVPEGRLDELRAKLVDRPREEVSAAASSELIRRIDEDQHGRESLISEFVDESVATLYETFVSLSADEQVDPRFVGTILVRHGSSE